MKETFDNSLDASTLVDAIKSLVDLIKNVLVPAEPQPVPIPVRVDHGRRTGRR